MAGTCTEEELTTLRRMLEWRAPAPTDARLLNVFMDQNNKCNLRCLTCGFSDARVPALGKYDMPRWLYDRIAAEVFPHCRHVCLSLMTEPFMTRDFPDRLMALREYEVPFSEVHTNGTLLTARAIEKTLDARMNRIIFSIDGGTKAVYEGLRPGARFEQVLANWNALRSARDSRGQTLPALRINHVLSEPNIDTFDRFLALAEELKADELGVRTVARMSEAKIQQSTDDAFWEKVRAVRVSLAAFCARTGIRNSSFLRDRPTPIELTLDSGEAMTCRYPWDWLSIYPNGDAFPCMAWSRPRIGSFVDQTFEEIWNGAALAELRREFEAVRPGVDCLHCTIRKAADDPDDDFFFRKLAMPPPPLQRP